MIISQWDMARATRITTEFRFYSQIKLADFANHEGTTKSHPQLGRNIGGERRPWRPTKSVDRQSCGLPLCDDECERVSLWPLSQSAHQHMVSLPLRWPQLGWGARENEIRGALASGSTSIEEIKIHALGCFGNRPTTFSVSLECFTGALNGNQLAEIVINSLSCCQILHVLHSYAAAQTIAFQMWHIGAFTNQRPPVVHLLLHFHWKCFKKSPIGTTPQISLTDCLLDLRYCSLV